MGERWRGTDAPAKGAVDREHAERYSLGKHAGLLILPRRAASVSNCVRSPRLRSNDRGKGHMASGTWPPLRTHAPTTVGISSSCRDPRRVAPSACVSIMIPHAPSSPPSHDVLGRFTS